MIRCDKTYSELWSLTDSKDILISETARMAIKAIQRLQEENCKYEKALGDIAFHVSTPLGEKENYEKTVYEFINISKRALGF